ncbi:MAG: NYN domain-containing protein [Gemmatimonadetes bacterium]|nr:NYN domain-containing protein [Gemmatimonadota bacterium]
MAAGNRRFPSRPESVLVDGYNVLHAVRRFAPRGAEPTPAREAFERWLAEAARRQEVADCVLVWDGGDRRRTRAPAPLSVLFAGGEATADERILDLCRGRYAARFRTTWVVSSDHGVQAPARELGFTVLGAMTFYERWSAAGRARARNGRERGGDPLDRNAKPWPTRREVDDLLREFLATPPGGEGSEPGSGEHA